MRPKHLLNIIYLLPSLLLLLLSNPQVKIFEARNFEKILFSFFSLSFTFFVPTRLPSLVSDFFLYFFPSSALIPETEAVSTVNTCKLHGQTVLSLVTLPGHKWIKVSYMNFEFHVSGIKERIMI